MKKTNYLSQTHMYAAVLLLICALFGFMNTGLCASVRIKQIQMAPVLFVHEKTCVSPAVAILPSNASNKKLQWSSSNKSVATVSNGMITSAGVGSAVITAAATDGSKVKASIVVYVYSSKYPVSATVHDATALRVRTGTSTSSTVVGHLANGAIKVYGPAVNGFYPIEAKDKNTRKTVYGFSSKDYITVKSSTAPNTPPQPPASAENKYAKKFAELRSIFPEGSYWSGGITIKPGDSVEKLKSSVSSVKLCDHPKGIEKCNYWGGAYRARQCMGFARVVGYYLTGKEIKASWKKFSKWEDLQPGDCVQLINGDHTMIVYTKTKDKIKVLDCNQDKACGILWSKEYTKDVVMKRLYCFYGYRP